MNDKVEAESEVDETFDVILARLNVVPNYPAQFVHFSDETIELLSSQNPKTLIDIVHFGQTLDQSTVVGADLRAFMNSLAHKDDIGIRKHIPYRRGFKGLHLAEAIGLIAEDLSEPLQVELLYQSGAILTDKEMALRTSAEGSHSEAQLTGALDKVTNVCEWFTAEAAELKEIFTSGDRPERFFLINDAPRTERVALALARLHFGVKESGGNTSGSIIGKLSSLFGR